jgi:energy-coupling factor transporter ATP-binding protein EcfA2
VRGDRGEAAVRALSLAVRAGEIVGVAGVSGNGQRELMEALVGQRRPCRARSAWRPRPMPPPAPRCSACASRAAGRTAAQCLRGRLSVADNMGLRNFDQAPFARGGWRLDRRLRARPAPGSASTASRPRAERPIRSLSGGNVQRAVLARELAGEPRLRAHRRQSGLRPGLRLGGRHPRPPAASPRTRRAVLLVSEDLDELLELSDRILVMTEGRIVHVAQDVATPRRRPRRPGPLDGGPLRTTHSRRGRMIRIDAFPYPYQFHPRARRWWSSTCSATSSRKAASAALGNDVRPWRRSCRPWRRCSLARQASMLVHTREAHLPDLSDCPRAKRLRGNPTLGIGDVGPMGRILVRGEPGNQICRNWRPRWRIVIDKPGKGAFTPPTCTRSCRARHHPPAGGGRHHRGLRADLDARGQRPGL